MDNDVATETIKDMNDDAATKKGLLDLPNELLEDILGACSTHALLSLASSNRRLRAVWLEHSTRIIKAAFGHVPHFEDAADLSLTERRLEGSVRSSDLDLDTELRLGLQRIVENIKLATLTCIVYDTQLREGSVGLTGLLWLLWGPAFYDKFRRTLAGDHPVRQHESLTSLPAAYYQVRWVMLAHRYPELRPQLLSDFLELSLAELRTIEVICYAVQYLYLDPSGACIRFGPHWSMRFDVPLHMKSLECWQYAYLALIAARLEKQCGRCEALDVCWWPEEDNEIEDDEFTDDEEVDMDLSD